jgi:hypothetical protein
MHRLLRPFLWFCTGILFLHVSGAAAQVANEYLGDEYLLYAETKQINQFFRRFNCEEDMKGRRLESGDRNYRDPELRRQYIQMLIDQDNRNMDSNILAAFIRESTAGTPPQYLDFYGNRWFAEVEARVRYEGREQKAVLFLSLEEENQGYKWVITNVYFHPFSRWFYNDSTAAGRFLHPMSHELDFMNLIKVFRDRENLEYYFDVGYKPDLRTLFLYEVKKGNLVFEAVENVKFHFFQVRDWYFEIQEFNRPGANSGWLISNLTKIPESQKDMLLKFLYYENTR